MKLLRLVRRGLAKPPRVIAERLRYEASVRVERYLAPRRARRLDAAALLQACGGASDIDQLWERLAERPGFLYAERVRPDECERSCPGDGGRILDAAEEALGRRVKLLGPDTFELGPRIDWLRDYRSGVRWPPGYMRDIVYVNAHDDSDVKVPWEISRLQWLIPAGQAFLLTGDEEYAKTVRAILEDWIEANPYAQTVNWSCTMEAALRILSWTWFFRVFHSSRAWADRRFRERFLRALYLHGDFTERHLEVSDVNGNHCTADAAGLVFVGLFFGEGRDATRWQQKGWSLLCEEITRQVYTDGVDFEASVAYHRLVTELFLLPALYRRAQGLEVPDAYRERLTAMARFATVYSRPHGSVPLWGDADDARALPLGGQDLNDHRYLAGLVGSVWDVSDLRDGFAGSRSEIFWLLGPSAAASLPDAEIPRHPPVSRAFREGGFFVMRNDVDHVFVDCGPVGLAGRGGHGHNDCLSFEAVLDGVHLVSDCGAYLYTACFDERNLFRSTASHNTPQIDGLEMNRIEPELLWTLEYDAKPQLLKFEAGPDADTFCGSHSGYERLRDPVTPVRTMILEHRFHRLTVRDAFEGAGRHRIEIPLHLAPGVTVCEPAPGQLLLEAGGRRFALEWDPPGAWTLTIGEGRISPTYGVTLRSVRLLWTREGDLKPALTVRITPHDRS